MKKKLDVGKTIIKVKDRILTTKEIKQRLKKEKIPYDLFVFIFDFMNVNCPKNCEGCYFDTIYIINEIRRWIKMKKMKL